MEIKPLHVLLMIGLLLIIGIMLGAIISKESLEDHAHMDPRDIPAMMEACEKNLPRTQTCKLIAVPNTEVTKLG